MQRNIPESDWRVFRTLRSLALDRFYKRVLDQVEATVQDDSRSPHERFQALFRLMRDSDRKLAEAFDSPRRSRMFLQLLAIDGLELLEPEEMEDFSLKTRNIAKAFKEDRAP